MITYDQILTQALALPVSDRASLIQSLLHSLPDPPNSFSSDEELAAELNRRIEAFEAGDMETVPFEDVIERARERLRQAR
jgi:putative addiction module component (TIGR02574 family)